MVLLDIDHFKQVNDVNGHQAGDEVLSQLAQIVTRSLRGSDWLVRFGGEEFMILLPGTPSSGAMTIAERLRNSTFDHLPPLEEGEEWMIADSGANRHYHHHNRFIFRREQMRNAIGGMTGGNQATTDEFGIFACRLEDYYDQNHAITSVTYSVLNAQVSLFS